MARRRKKKVPVHERPPAEGVSEILASLDDGGPVIWFPVKHFSPVCAFHVRRLIQQVKPLAVMVEGPQDATGLIPWIVDTDTRPPLTILSTYVDQKNIFGLNGTLSPSDTMPARYRAWWPLTSYCPEYVALKTGAEVGADLEFIDVPLTGTIPHTHVRTQTASVTVGDGNLTTNDYFDALAQRQRRRSFEDFWNANFEVSGWSLPIATFMRSVLTFAWCARYINYTSEEPPQALVDDGTLLREGHMLWCLDKYLRAHKDEIAAGRKVVVVTGAFHSVALPFQKKKRAKAKLDKNLETLLTAHSYRALSDLYALNRLPAYGLAIWDQLENVEVEMELLQEEHLEKAAAELAEAAAAEAAEAAASAPEADDEPAADEPEEAETAEEPAPAEADGDAPAEDAAAASPPASPEPAPPTPAPLTETELFARVTTQPFNAAAIKLLLEVMRAARDDGEGVSTADAVGAYTVARNLATLRGTPEIGLYDIMDAVQMGYVKGDVRVQGGKVEAATRQILVGTRLGRVTPEAGQAPLMRDFYDRCRTHRLDITGVQKTVRCDIHKQEKHKHKSAFLHQCNFLDIPMFGTLDKTGGYNRATGTYTPATHYKGPDLATGENMHLITETWGVKWSERVDDRLLEVSDRGASVAQGAASVLREQLVAARGNAAETSGLLLRCAQMMLIANFDEVLDAVEAAILTDSAFDNLVKALNDMVVLYSFRDALATQGHQRLLDTVVALYNKSSILLPGLANTDSDKVKTVLDRLQALVRITLTFEGAELDRELLMQKLMELTTDVDATSAVRGACFGILFSFGATREKIVARELEGYLRGSPDRVLQAGNFLDGLFSTSKNIFMGSPRLLHAINDVLAELEWDTFKVILPDMRRAFTKFIPSELDRVAERVSQEIGVTAMPSTDAPVPEIVASIGATADQQVHDALAGWW